MYVAEVQENILGIANNVRFQGKHYDFEVDSNQYALYANLNQKIQPDTALDVGVRLEKLDYDYSNKMMDLEPLVMMVQLAILLMDLAGILDPIVEAIHLEI